MSCLLFCVFIAPSCFGTIGDDIFFTKIAGLWGLTISISLDDSTTAGGAWHFCVGRLLLLRSKSGPVALSIITAYVNWLSDKRYYCVRINYQIGPLSRTEQKSPWPQAVFRTPLTDWIIFTILRINNQLGKSELTVHVYNLADGMNDELKRKYLPIGE